MNKQLLDLFKLKLKKPQITQRDLASQLNISLGKVNQLLDQLKQNGFFNEELSLTIKGKEYIENDYVFKKDNGRPYGVDAITKRFKKLLEQHHLPVIRFHDLRHSCASVLYEMGYDLKDIKEWLGHSDIKMTGNLYAHLGFRQKQDIAMSFEANFSSALEKTLEKAKVQAS